MPSRGTDLARTAVLDADHSTIRARACPVDRSHVVVFDFATKLVECLECECLLIDRRTARALLDLRAERDHLAAVVAAAEDYPRGRLERARVARVEQMHTDGLAAVAP